MPTPNPRIGVVVTSDQYRVLGELADLQGRSIASYVREMVDATMPMLEAMLPVYRSAAAAVALQPEALQTALRDALSNIDAKRAQLDLLRLLAATEANPANDSGAGAATSAASEDDGSRRRRKRP